MQLNFFNVFTNSANWIPKYGQKNQNAYLFQTIITQELQEIDKNEYDYGAFWGRFLKYGIS